MLPFPRQDELVELSWAGQHRVARVVTPTSADTMLVDLIGDPTPERVMVHRAALLPPRAPLGVATHALHPPVPEAVMDVAMNRRRAAYLLLMGGLASNVMMFAAPLAGPAAWAVGPSLCFSSMVLGAFVFRACPRCQRNWHWRPPFGYHTPYSRSCVHCGLEARRPTLAVGWQLLVFATLPTVALLAVAIAALAA